MPAGDEHGDDSVADFMHTSRSEDGLAYGWSYTNMAGPGFVAYVQSRLAGATASYSNLYYGSSLTFAVLRQEIDTGRPLVLSVDSSGDGVTDHAIVGIGYRETAGIPSTPAGTPGTRRSAGSSSAACPQATRGESSARRS